MVTNSKSGLPLKDDGSINMVLRKATQPMCTTTTQPFLTVFLQCLQVTAEGCGFDPCYRGQRDQHAWFILGQNFCLFVSDAIGMFFASTIWTMLDLNGKWCILLQVRRWQNLICLDSWSMCSAFLRGECLFSSGDMGWLGMIQMLMWAWMITCFLQSFAANLSALWPCWLVVSSFFVLPSANKWLVVFMPFFIVVKITNQFPSGTCPCFSGEKGWVRRCSDPPQGVDEWGTMAPGWFCTECMIIYAQMYVNIR